MQVLADGAAAGLTPEALALMTMQDYVDALAYAAGDWHAPVSAADLAADLVGVH